MTPAFLGTSFGVALVVPTDRYHARARTLLTELIRLRRRLVTTRAVLLELGNAFSKPRHRASGVRYLQLLEVSPDVEIVEVTAGLYAAGLALFAARPDKDWGLVDCVSFALMGGHGLTDALTADAHFAQAGFAALLV